MPCPACANVDPCRRHCPRCGSSTARPALERSRRQGFRRAKRSKGLHTLIVPAAIALVLLGSGGAWAYRELTHAPDSVPADDSLVPVPANEALSSELPADAAIYIRVSLGHPLASYLTHGLSFYGLGSIADALPFVHYILPGLHVMAGYPLALQDGELVDPYATQRLGSEQTRKAVVELLSDIDSDVALAVANDDGSTPLRVSMIAKVKDEALARRHLAALKQQLPTLSGLRIERGMLRVGDSSGGLDRARHFKRTMAHLPTDRFATLYVDGPRLKALASRYQAYLREGGELGDLLLAPVEGTLGDPALKDLLASLEEEHFSEQHLGMGLTNRLGLMQSFTHTDWEAKDPETLRKQASAVLHASMRPIAPSERAPDPSEALQFLRELQQ